MVLYATNRIFEFLPNPDGFVVRATNNKIAVMTDRESPNFSVVAFQLLDVLELMAS